MIEWGRDEESGKKKEEAEIRKNNNGEQYIASWAGRRIVYPRAAY